MQTLQRRAFEAVWLCPAYRPQSAPLQILSFTADSYETIKERERKASFRRNCANAKQNDDGQNRQDRREPAQFELGIDALSSFKMTDASSSLERPASPKEVRINDDSSNAQPYDTLRSLPDPLGSQRATVQEKGPKVMVGCLDLYSSLNDPDTLSDTKLLGNTRHCLNNNQTADRVNDADNCFEHGGILEDGESTRAAPSPTSLDSTTHNVPSGSWRSRSGQGGSTNWKYASMSKDFWTNEQDGYLLHLRNVAQLPWASLATYFPQLPPHALRQRYNQLSRPTEISQTSRDRTKRERRSKASPAVSPSKKTRTRKDHLDTSLSIPRRPTTSCTTERDCIARRHFTRPINRARQADNNADNANNTPLVPAAYEVAQRTSRSGRTILHPFRNRPAEGYI